MWIGIWKWGEILAKHEFGIMQDAPEPEKRYDEYEPRKYNCIAVDDDYDVNRKR